MGSRRKWPEDWLEAIIEQKCAWSCVRARDDLCVCRCGGRYHNGYRNEAAEFGLTLEQYMTA